MADNDSSTTSDVQAIWADLLQTDSVGLSDDFFELGGHSLVAVKVAARVREDMNLDLPVRAIFEARTPQALAEEIDRRKAAAADGSDQ